MRVFVFAVLSVAILGAITAGVLQRFQKPVSQAFATVGTRLSDN